MTPAPGGWRPPAADAGLVSGIARQVGAHRVQRLPPPDGSPNLHLAATTTSGERLFVKVYGLPGRARREAVAVQLLAPGVCIPLVRSGAGDTVGWNAFPYRTVVPYRLDGEADIRALGGRLAEVHETVAPADRLHRVPPLLDHLTRRLDDPAGGRTPAVLRRVRALVARAGPAAARVAADVEGEERPVLLHGDFGLRNVCRGERGRPVLFDLERAAAGPAYLDLARSTELELGPPAVGGPFLDAYRTGRRLPDDWPDPRYLWLTKVLVVLGMDEHARRVGSPTYAALARRVLARLEAAAGALW